MSATSEEGTASAAEPETKRGKKPEKQARKAARKKVRRTAERQIRFARFLALVLCGGGFLLIILGWAGAARRSCVDCQIPYLLSGGAAGLGLILLGVTIVVMAQLRTDSRRLAERIDALTRIMSEWWAPESESEAGTEAEAVQVQEEAPGGEPPAATPAQGTYFNLGGSEEPDGPRKRAP